MRWTALCVLAVLLPALHTSAEERALLLLSTTSTENSGLLDHLLPKFEAASGIKVDAEPKGRW